MSKIGRNYYAIIAEGHTPVNEGGVVDLSPKHLIQKSELKIADKPTACMVCQLSAAIR